MKFMIYLLFNYYLFICDILILKIKYHSIKFKISYKINFILIYDEHFINFFLLKLKISCIFICYYFKQFIIL